MSTVSLPGEIIVWWKIGAWSFKACGGRKKELRTRISACGADQIVFDWLALILQQDSFESTQVPCSHHRSEVSRERYHGDRLFGASSGL